MQPAKKLRSVYAKGLLLTFVAPLILVPAFFLITDFYYIQVHEWLGYFVLFGPVLIGAIWWGTNLPNNRWRTIGSYVLMMPPILFMTVLSAVCTLLDNCI